MSTQNNPTFNSDQFKYTSRSILGQSQVPGMARFLLSKGIVKTEKQAQGVLVTITMLFLLTSAYVFTVFVFDVQLFNKTPVQTPEQLQLRQERVERLKKQREQQQNNINNINNTQTPQ